MTATPWSDELDYCIALAISKGDATVPRASIISYFAVQAACARRERKPKLDEAFTAAAVFWKRQEYGAAEHTLRMVRLTLD